MDNDNDDDIERKKPEPVENSEPVESSDEIPSVSNNKKKDQIKKNTISPSETSIRDEVSLISSW